MGGTSIVPGMSTIDNAFGSIYNMFGGSGGGSPSSGNLFGTPLSGKGGGFGLTPLQNPDNSTTGLWYNMANLAGQVGPSLLNAGSNLISGGMGVTQGGLDLTGSGVGMSNTGFDTATGALTTLDPTINFYKQLLSGDPTAVTAALAPTASNLSTIYSGATGQTSGSMPAGGYRAATLAGLPQAQAAQVGNAALGLQPAAAQGLAAAANEQAGIGSTQAQIGQGVAGTGLGVAGTGLGMAGVGTTLTGQGETAIQNLIQDIIQKMSINYQYGGPQTFGTIAGGVGDILGGAGQAAYGMKAGGCWIAEAVYGVDDWRTHLVRAYLNGPFREGAFGRCVMAFYLRFGQAIAAKVRKYAWLKRAFRPLFDKALKRSLQWRLRPTS